MGWVDSPKFFCAFSETLADVTNNLVDYKLSIPTYGVILKNQPTHAQERALPIFIII